MKLTDLLRKENPKWIPQNRIIDDNNKFKDCPYCDGEIVQKVYGGILPMYDDPVCNGCETRFHPQRKWYILRGFSVERKQE